MTDVHPDLRRIAPFMPRTLAGPIRSGIMRGLGGLSRPRPASGVTVTELSEPTRLRVYRPEGCPTPTAGLVWIHGGGMVIGTARIDEANLTAIAKELGIVVVSVDYRLAPRHRYPAALEDCYAGLQWLHDQPDVATSRIAVGGASAGGGLAASLAQLAHDRGTLPVAFQLLIYPMLDDRSATATGIDGKHHRLWTQKSNRYGWRSYLGQEPGTDLVAAPAVPARRQDLSGLPPAWIGVGSHDLFHDEDVEYAARLEAAGVPVTLDVVPGAFHAFDLVAAKTDVAKGFRSRFVAALRDGISLT